MLDSDPLVALVDDDPAIALLAHSCLEGLGAVRVADCVEGSRALLRQQPDVLLLDLDLPDGRGEDVMARLADTSPGTTVFVLSAVNDVERAAGLMRRGASDYLRKPVDPVQLRRRVEEALVRRRLVRQASGAERSGALAKLALGPSPATERLVDRLRTVAATELTVLVRGETGSGKELVARALHAESRRADKPFVTVNCGALPSELIEAELFGHTAGAFTGASGARPGLVRQADGGTLFLDEVGELPLSLQPRLLRFLQEGEVRAVGSDRTGTVDVRVVAATHRDLRQAVQAGTFREDLLFRLSVLQLDVPPLRERAADIPVLAEHLLAEVAGMLGRRLDGFEPEALRALTAQPWPGNVRELLNCIQRAAVFAPGPRISARDLELEATPGEELHWPAKLFEQPFADARDSVVSQFERSYVAHALGEADGNVAEAARRSGLPRKSLWRIAQRVGLAADRASRKAGQLDSGAAVDPAALVAAEQAGYRERGRATVEELRDALAGTMRLEDWSKHRTAAHRLAGSGGSFGLPEVSRIASELEGALEELDREQGRALAEELLAALG